MSKAESTSAAIRRTSADHAATWGSSKLHVMFLKKDERKKIHKSKTYCMVVERET